MGKPTDAATRQINEAVGTAIAKARKAAGWSQSQLGAAVGREQATVSDWENGTSSVPIPMVVAIAEVLGLGPGALFIAAGLVPEAEDVLDRVRRDMSITEDRRELIIEIYEKGRERALAQHGGQR